MSGPPARPLFAARERRILLWLCAGAVCWRWLLAVRTPLAGDDAVHDLWVAAALADGDLGALSATFLGPWWGLCLAPFVACGVAPLLAAQVLGAVLGGLVLVPVALAAERMRAGAGVPAALCAFAMPAVSVGAAAGTEAALGAMLAALTCQCWSGGRWRVAVLLLLLTLADGWELAAPVDVRRAWSLAAPLALAALLPPRPRGAVALLLLLAGALALGLWGLHALPPWSSAVAVLAGIALARLPRRLCDLVLAAIAGLGLYDGWHGVEPPDALVERHVGRFVAGRVAAPDRIWSDFRRVWYHAGRAPDPRPKGPIEVYVMDRRRLDDSPFRVRVVAGCARLALPPALEDAARARGIVVLVPRE